MKNSILILFVFFSLVSLIQAQQNPDFAGRYFISGQQNGINQERVITVSMMNNSEQIPFTANLTYNSDLLTGTFVRWNYQDAVSIGDKCAVSGNGLYGVVGWGLNNPRITLYGNNNGTPIWEYSVANQLQVNYVAINYNGDLIAAGAFQNVYVFNNTSNVPIFNLDLNTFGGVPVAGPVALAQNEDFLIATSNLTDSSVVAGFNVSSTTPVWLAKIKDPQGGNGNIQGVRLSGNDSLMIVNTYGHFWVMETFTGNVIYDDLINPISAGSGTQATQGISYDGSIIATVNYFGYVRVFQRTGNTYSLMWQDQEPPGTYYNWANSVDVSASGAYIAVGTLIFVSANEVNGTVKLYRTDGGGTPKWIFNNCGDAVSAVSFNGDANVLAASSWGALDNSTPDLYIFKTWEGNTPIFTVNTAGSFFDTKISLNGTSLLTSGKAVHARTFGSGGLLYNISVDTSDTNIPVELTSFNAVANNGNVNLSWSTATETNNKGFEIERNSGNEFETITFIQGNGTSTQTHNYSFVDRNVAPGNYTYRLRQLDFDGASNYSNKVEVKVDLPGIYSLGQNYPNPFNPATQINFNLAEDSKVTLKIFDVLGREVTTLLNGSMPAGVHNVSFDATHLNSGVYFYRIDANGANGTRFTAVKKMMLIK